MSPNDPALLADALLDVVREAGLATLRHYRGHVAVETKADDSPVTAADREAEAIILAGLRRVAPGVPIIAEEEAAAGRIPSIGAEFFLVDPLDGTREFINKRDEFTVNIALVRDGRPVFGMVYAPVVSDLYVTVSSAAAARIRLDADAGPARMADLTVTPIRTREPPAAGLTAIASRSHSNEATERFLARYPIAERRTAGSSLKFCVVARGEADIYPRLGPTSEWDTAAGHAVLLAAGGSVVTLDGAPLAYGKTATRYLNPEFIAWGARRAE